MYLQLLMKFIVDLLLSWLVNVSFSQLMRNELEVSQVLSIFCNSIRQFYVEFYIYDVHALSIFLFLCWNEMCWNGDVFFIKLTKSKYLLRKFTFIIKKVVLIEKLLF